MQSSSDKKIVSLSKTSFMLGFVGFLFGPIFSIPAIICGHIARKRIKENNFYQGNMHATIGLVLGYTGIIVFSITILILIF